MAFSATKAAFEGFRLIKAKPGAILGWALFYAVALIVIIGGGMLIFGTSALAELKSGQDRHYESLEEALPLLQAAGAFLGFLFVTFTIVASIQLAAVYRAVLRPGDRGFAYMKFGGDELRQIALIIFFMLLHGLIWGGVFGGLITLHALDYIDGPGAVASYFSGFAIACFLSVFFGVRLSLAPPMTFAKRRLHLGRAWSLTRGNFWALLGMFVLALIFAIILSLGGDAIGQAVMGAAGLTALSWHEPKTYDFADWSSVMLAALGGYVLIHVVSQALQLAVFYGPQAAAYRDLMAERNPPPASEADDFGPGPGASETAVGLSAAAVTAADHAPQASHAAEPVITAEPASGAAVHGAAAEHEAETHATEPSAGPEPHLPGETYAGHPEAQAGASGGEAGDPHGEVHAAEPASAQPQATESHPLEPHPAEPPAHEAAEPQHVSEPGRSEHHPPAADAPEHPAASPDEPEHPPADPEAPKH